MFKKNWCRALVRLLLALCAVAPPSVAWCSPSGGAASKAVPGPTVREVVEFTRIVQPDGDDKDRLRTQVSPNGQRAFIVTRKAEVGTDRNLFDILLLDLSPDRLETGRYERPRRLLRVEASQDYYYVIPSIQDARWADNRTIVFLGRLHDGPFQVYKLDVETRRVTQLTFANAHIVSFDVSSDLRRVAFVAQIPNPPMPQGARSVVVANQSFWSVKFGQNDLRPQIRHHQYFVAVSGSRVQARSLGRPFQSGAFAPRLSISPDGRWVLAPRFEGERQAAWAQQYPIVAEATARFGRSLSLDPLSYFSRPMAYVVRRMVAYRSSDGAERPVLDAPDDTMTNASQWRSDRIWQGRGESVVIAGTHLPDAGKDAVGGSHIIEYWPDSGRWEIIAALSKRLIGAYRTGEPRDAFVAFDGDQRRYFERRAEGGWQERPVLAQGETDTGPLAPNGWSLRIEQDLNQPPEIVARRPDGRSVQLTRLNPQFSAESWGVMRPYAWKDEKGRQWDGGLMTPAAFDPGARHALVIQTYEFSASRFYLDGPTPAFSSGFAGRAFLRGDTLVLAMPWAPSTDAPRVERSGLLGFMDGVEGAISALVKSGLVDAERIGILGWSATGERVLNLVTFSNAPIRAATLLDGDANTLFSFTVTYGAGDSMSTRRETANEARPFGDTLDRWVRNDPGMHTDCVKAALRIETYGPLVLNNWDIYALLRRQYKAAEMIVIPAGAHSLSRPSERMISLQGNVDWYRFWLNDDERTELVLPGETKEGLRAQYARWRQMAELKKADDAKPRCARSEGAR
jgi:dipeptidyl aminopeptidase/acylaminoacyl peptidase